MLLKNAIVLSILQSARSPEIVHFHVVGFRFARPIHPPEYLLLARFSLGDPTQLGAQHRRLDDRYAYSSSRTSLIVYLPIRHY